jgi:membrane associated rhomboid family serine protease
MLLPIGHENMEARRWPVITTGLIIINLAVFLFTIGTIKREAPELAILRYQIRTLAATHTELTLPPTGQTLVDDIKKSNPAAWEAAKNPSRDVHDLFDAQVRLSENPELLQQQMDRLCARYDELQQNSLLEHWAFVPSHPTWYSYITANFLHGGWLHIIGNMWFLWLAGIVLEEAWGRGLYLVVYLLAGAFALQVQAFCEAGSHIPTLGASGAVAALMGAFLVRFPTVKIRMAFIFFIRLYRFSAAAYWLLPLWFLMEFYYGAMSGSSGGVAHMAHVGGFAFGMACAGIIRVSGLERVIDRRIEDKIDPDRDQDLDAIHDLIKENRIDDAIVELQAILNTLPNSERGLLMIQELYWRQNKLADYARATEQLCALHLAQHNAAAGLKDYEEMVQSGGLPAAELWMKLCQALEDQQEYERAVGEYQELAEAYPQDRQSLMALMAAARLAMSKLRRPQQALILYKAVAESPLPHLDLDAMVRAGTGNAVAAIGMAP